MKHLAPRYGFFVLGVAINSFGVAFITKSALGTSQISSVPYVLSLWQPSMSFGMTTFLFNMLFILTQIVLLKRDFHPIQFLQIAVNLLFSSLIDVSMALLWFFQPETLLVRLISLLVGCVILAFGMTIVIRSEAGTGPNDLVAVVISDKSKKPFGPVRVAVDVCFAAIGFALGGVLGLGTVICAFVVGPAAQIFLPISQRICEGCIRKFAGVEVLR